MCSYSVALKELHTTFISNIVTVHWYKILLKMLLQNIVVLIHIVIQNIIKLLLACSILEDVDSCGYFLHEGICLA